MVQNSRCSACGQLQRLKLTGIYARWYPYGSESIGYQLNLCDECVQSKLVPVLKATYNGEAENGTCPACHESGLPRLEYTWLTLYARNEDAVRCTVAFCERCAERYRVQFTSDGKKLEDRPRPPQPSKPAYWQALGIDPRQAS